MRTRNRMWKQMRVAAGVLALVAATAVWALSVSAEPLVTVYKTPS